MFVMNRNFLIVCVLAWFGACVVVQSATTAGTTAGTTADSTTGSTTDSTTDACDGDGAPEPEIKYSIECIIVRENVKTAILTVTRTGNGGVTRLDYTVRVKGRRNRNSAVPRNIDGRVFFKEGETTATIKVPIKNDNRVENTDENFTVTINNLTPNKGTIEKDTANLQVLDDD